MACLVGFCMVVILRIVVVESEVAYVFQVHHGISRVGIVIDWPLLLYVVSLYYE